jgi:hypothetical protein
MKNFLEFLMETPVDGITETVKINSRRLKDKEYEFVIRPISAGEYSAMEQEALDVKRKIVHTEKLLKAIILAGVVEPNFKDAEAIKKMGVATPQALLDKILTAGELAMLRDKIFELSDLSVDINEEIEEAKNS